MEKTAEELKVENEQLIQQLSTINEKLLNLGNALLAGKEQNVKLTYAVRLFAETHLTRDEKLAIAQEFDRAVSAEQVEKIYSKHIDQIRAYDDELEYDFMWSPGFSRELEKYYFKYKGYNPFEAISSSMEIIRTQFKIEDDLRLEDSPEKTERLREAWHVNRELCLVALDEIMSITNEILKK